MRGDHWAIDSTSLYSSEASIWTSWRLLNIIASLRCNPDSITIPVDPYIQIDLNIWRWRTSRMKQRRAFDPFLALYARIVCRCIFSPPFVRSNVSFLPPSIRHINSEYVSLAKFWGVRLLSWNGKGLFLHRSTVSTKPKQYLSIFRVVSISRLHGYAPAFSSMVDYREINVASADIPPFISIPCIIYRRLNR